MTTFRDFKTVERSRLDYALLVFIVLLIVFGLSRQMGQIGQVAGWAAWATYMAESRGSLRQRAGGMIAFAIFGFIQIVLVALVGSTGLPFLVLLFAVSFVCSWMMGYGDRGATVGFVSNIWITLMPDLGVGDDLALSLLGFVAGSMLIIVASIIPPLLRNVDVDTDGQNEALVFNPRGFNRSTLIEFSLFRAAAITLGGFIGQQYLELNQLWVAMTVNLIMPPELKTTWRRGIYRAVGATLGGIMGFMVVRFFADNGAVLLIIEMIAIFGMIYTTKGFIYGVFVFFLSFFLVTRFGFQGVDIANVGANEWIVAAFIGVSIAFVTMLILKFIVARDTYSTSESTAVAS